MNWDSLLSSWLDQASPTLRLPEEEGTVVVVGTGEEVAVAVSGRGLDEDATGVDDGVYELLDDPAGETSDELLARGLQRLEEPLRFFLVMPACAWLKLRAI